jgi:TldD protein
MHAAKGKNMFSKLKEILARADVDYADIRYETKKNTLVAFAGSELNQVSSSATDGFVLRVLYKGGFASTVFTRPEDAQKAVALACESAKTLSRHCKEPVRLAKAPVIKDYFRPTLNEDPAKISLEEKIELTRRYNAIPLGDSRVVTTTIGYSETLRDRFFASTEGAEVREELSTVSISGQGLAKDDKSTQNMRFGIGGSDGFARLRGRENVFEDKTRLLGGLLTAKPVTGGIHNVIVDPELGGVFIHEAFGHFSEADLIEDMPELRKKMSIGAQLGSEAVNITDDPTAPGQLGFYKYDDEGVPAARVELMKKGVLCGRLHSRRTAAAFGDAVNGHCVAEDYRYAPMIRMGTIKLEPDPDMDFERLLGMLGDGLYLCGAKGGQTSGENFTFAALYGYEVENGKIKGMLRDINLMGNLFETFANVRAAANDAKLVECGGCGKNNQTNIRSCLGGPHFLIKNAVVGGR